MKPLIIGDLHIKSENLEETKPLLERIINLSSFADLIIILGDIYHNHGILKANEIKMVHDFFKELSTKNKPVYYVVGNHDYLSDEVHHSLYTHANYVNIITEATRLTGTGGTELGFIPFRRSNEKFKEDLESLINNGVKTIFCHQEFNGCQYENGFYAPHGFDFSGYPGINFISGHIHKIQKISNVDYVGAPRWISKNDANQDRGVWFLTLDKDGNTTSREFIDSSDICPKYHSITVTDQDLENLPKFGSSDKVYVEYVGSDDKAVKKIQKAYNNLYLTKKPVRVESKAKIRESDSLMMNIESYVNNFDAKCDKIVLLEEIKRRLEQ